jgi:hypothetical protein
MDPVSPVEPLSPVVDPGPVVVVELPVLVVVDIVPLVDMVPTLVPGPADVLPVSVAPPPPSSPPHAGITTRRSRATMPARVPRTMSPSSIASSTARARATPLSVRHGKLPSENGVE